MLEHGGRRRAAALQYGIAESDWLDLSTGINPDTYPVPPLPAEVWNRLPEDDDGLIEAAARYYGAADLLPMAGSQAAIQLLPYRLPRGRVAALQPSYAEHRYHWQGAGHAIEDFAAADLERVAAQADVVVLCQPNNPDAITFDPARLLLTAQQLAQRGGHLVIDEAFVDATPECSVIAHAGSTAPNLIVLRSLGKFFGLAGARVGFVAGPPGLCHALREAAGPWALSGPARWAARAALADENWQHVARQSLAAASQRLHRLLSPLAGNGKAVANPLFVWLPHPRAESLAEQLAHQAVLVRFFNTPDCTGLRVGLPGAEGQWQRLAAALGQLK